MNPAGHVELSTQDLEELAWEFLGSEFGCVPPAVKEFGRRFPRRPASLKEGTHVRVEEDIACAAVAGRD